VNESEQEAPLLNDDADLVTDWNTAVSSLGPSNKTQSAITDDTQRPNQDSDVVEPTTLVDEKPIAVASANNENENEKEANTENVWIGPSQYAIQMLAMKDERVLEQFLLEYGLYDKTRVYKTQRYGGDWFVVVDKTLYPNFNDAQRARSTLPDFPGKQNAFVKNGEQVLKELALTDNP
jgi:DamX protein